MLVLWFTLLISLYWPQSSSSNLTYFVSLEAILQLSVPKWWAEEDQKDRLMFAITLWRFRFWLCWPGRQLTVYWKSQTLGQVHTYSAETPNLSSMNDGSCNCLNWTYFNILEGEVAKNSDKNVLLLTHCGQATLVTTPCLMWLWRRRPHFKFLAIKVIFCCRSNLCRFYHFITV